METRETSKNHSNQLHDFIRLILSSPLCIKRGRLVFYITWELDQPTGAGVGSNTNDINTPTCSAQDTGPEPVPPRETSDWVEASHGKKVSEKNCCPTQARQYFYRGCLTTRNEPSLLFSLWSPQYHQHGIYWGPVKIKSGHGPGLSRGKHKTAKWWVMSPEEEREKSCLNPTQNQLVNQNEKIKI